MTITCLVLLVIHKQCKSGIFVQIRQPTPIAYAADGTFPATIGDFPPKSDGTARVYSWSAVVWLVPAQGKRPNIRLGEKGGTGNESHVRFRPPIATIDGQASRKPSDC